MAELGELIKLFQRQMDSQREQTEALVAAIAKGLDKPMPAPSIPSFPPFDSTSELWTDYLARFYTFIGANSVPENKTAQVFLTSQSKVTYKLLCNLASQQSPAKDINDLTIDEIIDFMKNQFDPARYIVRERFKFWSEMQRKPGETIHELAARIRQDAVTCDFPSIKDPLDEAMRTRFMCSVNNEAVLKALFKVKDSELTFAKAISTAVETEDAARVAKETVYGAKHTSIQQTPVHKIQATKKMTSPVNLKPGFMFGSQKKDFPKGTCPRCGKTDHASKDCPHMNSICHFCQKLGHIESACLQKRRGSQPVKNITKFETKTVKSISSIPQLQQHVRIQGQDFIFEVDTGAADNFCSHDFWVKLGRPSLKPATCRYEVANGQPLHTLGTFKAVTSLQGAESKNIILTFTVTNSTRLNLLGRNAIVQLGVNVQALLGVHVHAKDQLKDDFSVKPVFENLQPDAQLQMACQGLCEEFPDLFKKELGCLTGFELEVKFKENAAPVFCKPRTVPFAIQDDLNQAYEAGIAKGVWKPVQFNDYGTPVVPIRKKGALGQPAKIRVCGDYSVTVNSQLETHRYRMPLPDDLMRKLSGGYGFSKVDLADAYNQIKLGPESQKRLALSTHRGVLLQCRLPFGISSAPGYFQEVMDKMTADLQGVCVYLDDILVSGDTASSHLQNLRALFQRLQERGLRCRLEKCSFAQPSVEYLGFIISNHGIAKGHKVDAVVSMPAPTDVSSLRSFLGSVQFYNKFLSNLATITDPLYRLTKKGIQWKWGSEEQATFQKLKNMLCADTVLAHFDPSLLVGVSCDASEVGLGAVLFHRYADGSERPIANISKTLTDTQRRYSQIQKEALAIVFSLKKFHQFLYGRRFILVTDHRPLIALFGPTKATPALAANRLARWALMLSQYDYSIEYRRTADHGNADALSRLPAGPDATFDSEESEADIDTVCTIKVISLQLNPADPGVLAKESAKDPVIANVMRYCREGWPVKAMPDDQAQEYSVEQFRKLSVSLSTVHGCLLHGTRVVIPPTLQPQVLELLHLGHFGIQRMKQLARTAVYWPGIDTDITNQCHRCQTCAEHQTKPAKPANHPWMLPEKPWSRIHVDHAINFLGTNWLVLVDAYSKYPCIHPTTSTSTKATTDLLEEDFAHFGYPHTIVSDNATTFSSEEFQAWCRERGIIHLTGAPYHPATNGAAERLVQTFKRALVKSSLPPKSALQQFLMQYRRTPLVVGYSPSEFLNGRQIRSKIDILLPSPAHIVQGRQAREATKSQAEEISDQQAVHHIFKVGMPCYALYCGPRRDKDPRWVPAVVTKVFGTRSVNVRVLPKGSTWRRHIEQLRPRYGVHEDADPGEPPSSFHTRETTTATDQPSGVRHDTAHSGVRHDTAHLEEGTKVATHIPPLPQAIPKRSTRNPRLPTGTEYGPGNPRRSARLHT